MMGQQVKDATFLDATAQAARVRSQEASPIELVEETISRIERLDPDLNAVVIPLFDKARAEARTAPDGPFRGVPYLLKDLALVSKGDLTAHGIAGVKSAGYRAEHDSFFVERMRDAGFILLGKTNLPEMGMSTVSTESAAWGPTRNPWDTARSTGGSSGGSAAAVAAGMVAIAHGTDAVGSIRIPASHCGTVGLKGSRGRVSAGPDVFCDNLMGLAEQMCLARSVRDVASVLDIVSGHRPGDAYCAPPPERAFVTEVGADAGRRRIGVLAADPNGRGPTDPECEAAARAAAGVLADLGHDVSEDFPPALASGGLPELGPAMSVVTRRGLDFWGNVLGRPLTEEDVEPGTWQAAEYGSTVSGTQYAEGVDSLRVRAREIETWWQDDGWDLLLTPTVPMKPTLLESVEGAVDHDPATFTFPFNVSGQPAISLPLHRDADGLPIGVQLVAAYGREDLLLRVASQLESAMPWSDRHPAIASTRH
jgi:Asp-tRNA(Asn)/Glu-tRNA(Gln) amidotransferase A subunit family amidase